MKEYKRAEVEYQTALQQRKLLLKSKTKLVEADGTVFSEIEVSRKSVIFMIF